MMRNNKENRLCLITIISVALYLIGLLLICHCSAYWGKGRNQELKLFQSGEILAFRLHLVCKINILGGTGGIHIIKNTLLTVHTIYNFANPGDIIQKHLVGFFKKNHTHRSGIYFLIST